MLSLNDSKKDQNTNQRDSVDARDLALLIGFTFAQSLERYDAQSEAVIDEANTIGTAYLLTDSVPSVRQQGLFCAMQKGLGQAMESTMASVS